MPPKETKAAESGDSTTASQTDNDTVASTDGNDSVAGTTEVDLVAEANATGVVRMKNDVGGGASVEGQSYEPDESGVITVPLSAHDILVSHGFSQVK